MDKQGYVVTLQTPFEGAKDAANLATAGADPLRSQFTPSYGMVLNLLQTHAGASQGLVEQLWSVCGEAEVEAAVHERSRNFKHN